MLGSTAIKTEGESCSFALTLTGELLGSDKVREGENKISGESPRETQGEFGFTSFPRGPGSFFFVFSLAMIDSANIFWFRNRLRKKSQPGWRFVFF